MIELSGLRVVVVGLGASGLAAARLCAARGADVTATDVKHQDDLAPTVRDECRALEAGGVRVRLGGHAGAGLEAADLVVVSPGVPGFPALHAAERRGATVIGEVELATRALRCSAPIVAIGGTNGKSTTTTLVGAILEEHGLRTFVGGNLGEPLAGHADEPWEAVVLEVSSFQMERVDTFRPRVSVLLNVTDDHLDRYPDMAAYADAKGNAFVRQTAEDVAVVPAHDGTCLRQARRGGGHIVTFGRGGDIDVDDGAIVDTRSSTKWLRAELTLAGEHNALNVAAAIAAVTPFGVRPETIRSALAAFRGLPHRMALVAEVGGVRFYDDSKGTNVGASVMALRGLRERRAVLIAGGRDKGGSYEPLVEALRDRGKAAVLIGEARDAIARAIGDVLPVHQVLSLREAVRLSHQLAAAGDAVLLSPACSSYDMFVDYRHRGDEFAREVRALVEVRS